MWVLITSTVIIEDNPTAAAVVATVEGFPTPSLPKHSGNPGFAAIKETQQLMMANAASIDCDLGGGHNGYLGLILPPKQYARVSRTSFVLPSDSGRTEQVPSWKPPTEEKRILRKHAEKQRLYNKYRNVYYALKDQLLAVFEYTYLETLKNDYMGYATRSTMELIAHLYEHYTRISSADMAENDEILRAPYNTEEPLKILIDRLNECADFATAASEMILETQLVRIAYLLVDKKVQ